MIAKRFVLRNTRGKLCAKQCAVTQWLRMFISHHYTKVKAAPCLDVGVSPKELEQLLYREQYEQSLYRERLFQSYYPMIR